MVSGDGVRRLRIAFFEYPDVFEDFYPHYGVDQRAFATRWTGTSGHALVSLLQREVGDVTWYETTRAPEIEGGRHDVTGCRVRFIPSSLVHRLLWRAFYLPRHAWRWRSAYRPFATVASYVAPLSVPLWRALRHDRPDCLFVQSYSSGRFDVLLLAARLLGIPLIACHVGGEPEGYLGATVRRWTLRGADRIIASSGREAEQLARRYRVPSARIRVILTPIDTTAFCPLDRAAACRAVGLDPLRRYLLFVGRFDDGVKRISSIIEAFAAASANHPDAALLIAGGGKDDGRLRSLARAIAPGRVRFMGWVDDTRRKTELYNCAECLVLASRREGFPTVVGEAMACGTPVVSSNVGGVSELVEHDRTGWLFEPGDDEALRDILAMVLADPQRVRSMRVHARQAAEDRVSPERVAGALRECFDV